MFYVDLTRQIASILRAQGLGDVGKISIRGICDIPLFGIGGLYVGIIGPIRIRDNVDDVFEQIKKGIIESKKKRGCFPGKILLQGGGNLPIPEWFKDWCKENNIVLQILDAESILERKNIDFEY